jgi:CDP-glucose 4,6-dehydratase
MELNYRDLFTKTYKGKKVFLTGHTGFKGAWLLAWLNILGANVKGYSLAPQNELDLFNSINGTQLCESIIADIRDKDRLKKEILDFQPDFIFHLAAQPLVRYSYSIPVETFEVNAIGTGNVLDSLRFLNKPCTVIIITTDKVYENKEWHYPYRENDRLGGYDPYSASKACAEILVTSFRNSFFNIDNYNIHKKIISTARAGNVIGGGDWSMDRIIPDIARALKNEQAIEVRSPNAVRPWQHVLEPLSGYLLLGATLNTQPTKSFDSFNFGPNASESLTVLEVVQKAISTWGSGTFVDISNIDKPHEANLLTLDISKTINLLKWQPKLNNKEAIEWTIDWYKKSKTDIVDFTYHQINLYQNL